LGDGGAGIVADLGQTDQLAAGLATLLCDTDRRRDAGQRARALAVEHFSPTNVAGRYADLYATLHDHGRR
jgi:glycosyltransferase involved in cell wall biosynthesis